MISVALRSTAMLPNGSAHASGHGLRNQATRYLSRCHSSPSGASMKGIGYMEQIEQACAL